MCLIYAARWAIRTRRWPLNTLLSDAARHESTPATLSQLQENTRLQSDKERNLKEINTWRAGRVGLTLKSRTGRSSSGEGR